MTRLDVRLPCSIFSNSQHPLHDLHLGHFTTSSSQMSFGFIEGVIFDAASAPLSLKLASTIHMGYDEPLQDETIVRIKVFL